MVVAVASPRNQTKSPLRQFVSGLFHARNAADWAFRCHSAECQQNQCFPMPYHRVVARPCHTLGTWKAISVRFTFPANRPRRKSAKSSGLEEKGLDIDVRHA